MDLNEDKPGYKKTKIGWIPEEWEDCLFSEVMTGFSSGSTPTRTRPDYFKGEILWITSGELNYNKIVDTKERLTEEAVNKSNLKIISPGTFLIAITGLEAAGTRGSCGIVCKYATTNQSCMALKPKEALDINYLYQYYCAYGEYLAFRYTQGTKQQSYNGEIVKKLPIPLPPLPEQRRIAEILGTWDAAIRKLDALIAKKQELKKGLMQQLLTGRTRFPEFVPPGGTRYQDTKLGKVPADWKVVRLGEVVKSVKRKLKWDENALYDLISVKRRSAGVFYRESLYGHKIKTKTLQPVKKGDFLISKMQIVHGASGLTNYEHDGMMASASYIILRPTDPLKLDMNFFELLSRMPWFYHLTYVSSYGVHIEKMTFDFKDFLKRSIYLPELEEQKRIAECFRIFEKEVSCLKEIKSKLEAQKQGLMHRLLTGASRVKLIGN